MKEKDLKICSYCGNECEIQKGIIEEDKFCCNNCIGEIYRQCDCCYELYHKDTMIEVADVFVCKHCEDDADVYKCEDCGNIFYKKDLIKISGDYYCGACASFIDYNECSHCHDNVYINNGVTTIDTNEFYCCDCRDSYLSYCECCMSYFYYSLYTDVDNEPVCSECISEYYRECQECGEMVYYESALYDSSTDNYYCSNCYNKLSTVNLHSWNYKPKWKMVKMDNENSDKNMFIGIELEINREHSDLDIRKKCVDNICENNEYIYCKMDGSVSNGFEIVSQPCTYNAHNQMVDWKNIFNTNFRRYKLY